MWITLAIFKLSEKISIDRDLLNTSESWAAIDEIIWRTTFGETLFSLGLELGLSRLAIEIIFSVISRRYENCYRVGLFKKSLDLLERGGILISNFGPMLTKYSLNDLAITTGSVEVTLLQ